MKELLEILLAAYTASPPVFIAILVVYFWRSREKTTMVTENNISDSLDVAKSTLAMFGDLSANIKASTETLLNLNKSVNDQSVMLDGFRREVGTIHGSQIEALRNIQQTMVLLPNLTAGKVREDLGPVLNDVRGKLESAVVQIASACMRIDQLGLKPGEEKAIPEVPPATPETPAVVPEESAS